MKKIKNVIIFVIFFGYLPAVIAADLKSELLTSARKGITTVSQRELLSNKLKPFEDKSLKNQTIILEAIKEATKNTQNENAAAQAVLHLIKYFTASQWSDSDPKDPDIIISNFDESAPACVADCAFGWSTDNGYRLSTQSLWKLFFISKFDDMPFSAFASFYDKKFREKNNTSSAESKKQ